jgi:hypothetical protein
VASLVRYRVKKGVSFLDESGNIKERAIVLLKLGYEQMLSSPMSVATIEHVGPQLDPPLHKGVWEEERERDELAARLAELEPASDPRESDVSASEERDGERYLRRQEGRRSAPSEAGGRGYSDHE